MAALPWQPIVMAPSPAHRARRMALLAQGNVNDSQFPRRDNSICMVVVDLLVGIGSKQPHASGIIKFDELVQILEHLFSFSLSL